MYLKVADMDLKHSHHTFKGDCSILSTYDIFVYLYVKVLHSPEWPFPVFTIVLKFPSHCLFF